MSIRVRFAPSPTGKVHIGNIRAAIFNYLFARHNGGKFLLRVEDTDIERSTPEAIEALFEVMTWLGLDYDEEVFYQTSQADQHLEAAQKLIDQGDAYKFAKGDSGEAVLYRIPFNCDEMEGIKTVGSAKFDVHQDVAVKVDSTGISFAQISKKGKAMETEACLAGFKDLQVFNADNEVVFTINDNIDAILSGEKSFVIDNAARFEFTRRSVGYTDLVKGELSKPLDSMKDMVIVRSNGTPIFHLSNVCDDITQNITHIIRGDDHVENTYRHLLLFQSLGGKAPAYGHLPMIVNASGKPYSKRDGDAFVGDFQDKGFMAKALFNYLSLLGWSPGDDREKMTIDEMVEFFTLERVKSTAAQMDHKKLTNLNGQYIAEMDATEFVDTIKGYLADQDWFNTCEDEAYLKQVCALMQSRTNLFADCSGWSYFFTNEYECNEKAVKRTIGKPQVAAQLIMAKANLAEVSEWTVDNIDKALKATAIECEIGEFKLHQPFRVAITGVTNGAGVLEIAELLGQEEVLFRIQNSCTITE